MRALISGQAGAFALLSEEAHVKYLDGRQFLLPGPLVGTAFQDCNDVQEIEVETEDQAKQLCHEEWTADRVLRLLLMWMELNGTGSSADKYASLVEDAFRKPAIRARMAAALYVDSLPQNADGLARQASKRPRLRAFLEKLIADQPAIGAVRSNLDSLIDIFDTPEAFAEFRSAVLRSSSQVEIVEALRERKLPLALQKTLTSKFGHLHGGSQAVLHWLSRVQESSRTPAFKTVDLQPAASNQATFVRDALSDFFSAINVIADLISNVVKIITYNAIVLLGWLTIGFLVAIVGRLEGIDYSLRGFMVFCFLAPITFLVVRKLATFLEIRLAGEPTIQTARSDLTTIIDVLDTVRPPTGLRMAMLSHFGDSSQAILHWSSWPQNSTASISNAKSLEDENDVHATFRSDATPYITTTADALVILASSIVGGIGYAFSVGNPIPDLALLSVFSIGTSFIYILRMTRSGYYAFSESTKPPVETQQILINWFTTGLLMCVIAFLLKIPYSRGAFVSFYLLAPLGLLVVRKLTKICLPEVSWIRHPNLVLVGDAKELESFEQRDFFALFGAMAVKRFTLSRNKEPSARAQEDALIIARAADFVRQHDCKEVLLALPWNDVARVEFLRDQIKRLPVAVRLMPDMNARLYANLSSPLRSTGLQIQSAPLSGSEQFVKRLMDVIGASAALIFFLPIIVLTAIAIRLDSPGPVIFRQTRQGFNGKNFAIYKFRTMTVQEVSVEVRNDARVTSLGRLLRSSSIDELPQLWNVLRGDMSLVGPRPHAIAHDTYFETVLSDYAFRHRVKPGITGWAQCNGLRGATPTIEHIAERVRFDLWYINNWSIWLDIQIMLKTCFEVVRRENSY